MFRAYLYPFPQYSNPIGGGEIMVWFYYDVGRFTWEIKGTHEIYGIFSY